MGQWGPETFWAEIWGFIGQTWQKTHYDFSLGKFHCSALPLSILNTRGIKSLGFLLTKKYKKMCYWKLRVYFLTHGMLEGST